MRGIQGPNHLLDVPLAVAVVGGTRWEPMAFPNKEADGRPKSSARCKEACD